MKILLIAYEFPPIVAAQALRWFYLANGLAERGVDVHVVCPAMPAAKIFPGQFHPSVHVHRTWPGPFVGVSQRIARRARNFAGATSAVEVGGRASLLGSGYLVVRRLLDVILYPDVRTEWFPYARHRIRQLFQCETFDAVVSSHEPGVDLLLGLWVKRRYGVRWLVDLADPLLAPYSPCWRRRLDRWVEAKVLSAADSILVTTPELIDLLCRRHGESMRARFVVVPQGGPSASARRVRPGAKRDAMNVLFTGTFYSRFRDPSVLAEALRRVRDRDIVLTVVGDNGRFTTMFEGLDNVRFVGKLDHFTCLKMQQDADVLLNVGNVQDYQVPGKVFEYLGAGRPILHVRTGLVDSGAGVVEQTGSGIVVDNQPDSIASALVCLHEAWRQGRLDSVAVRREDAIASHTWDERAGRCISAIERIVANQAA